MINETSLQDVHLSRRRLLTGAVALGAGAALLGSRTSIAQAAPQASAAPRHLVWVWQFTTDAEPNYVGARLLANNVGIVLKSHDGLQWMSEYDKSPYALSGPAQAEVLAKYFETAGVPFHAWAVVQGVDAVKEARMAADVLSAGARSIFLDIEPHAGFWRGTPADAEAFGRELRRLQPNGRVSLSIDPRPWMLDRLPMKQFLEFSDEVAPQQYWRTFNTQANYDKFNQTGFPVGPEGVTPEFLATVQKQVLGPMGRPIAPVGQGATPDPAEWRRFIDRAFADGSTTVSAWRYGVTTPEVLAVLRDMPPAVPVVPAGPELGVYVVQPGDTLGAISAKNGVSTDEIMRLNGMTDPNFLVVGQELKLAPGATTAAAAVAAPAPAASNEPVEVHAASASNSNGRRSYTVVEGDTLSGLAGKFGSSVDAILKASSLSDPNALSIGQQLFIP